MSFYKESYLRKILKSKLSSRVFSVSFFILVFFFVGSVNSTVATEYMRGTKLNQIEDLFVPSGYDDNDPVVILAYEEYDMSCEELVSYDTKVDEDRKIIYLNSRKVSYSLTGECSGSLEPVYKEFEVGELEKGVYTIVGNGPRPIKKTLVVRGSSTESVDTFNYPEILEARMGLRPNGKAYLYLDITLEDSCEYVESIDIKRRGRNFWELYPKMKRVPKASCNRSLLIQTEEVLLGEIPHETHIFFIRENDGESSFYFEALI